MNKPQRLRICDWLLLAVSVLMLASSIQLEVTSGSIHSWVWVHIVLGLLFFFLIGRHLYLHFQWRNWLKLLWKPKKSNMKWMTVTGLLTLLTAMVATTGWIVSPDHSFIGAVHGKLGFLFEILAAWHIYKRMAYYRK